jgi:hypothetical protein
VAGSASDRFTFTAPRWVIAVGLVVVKVVELAAAH